MSVHKASLRFITLLPFLIVRVIYRKTHTYTSLYIKRLTLKKVISVNPLCLLTFRGKLCL